MNPFNKSTQAGLVILLILQAVILIGCAQFEELTNDPPEITTFTIPNEVEYGETVTFKARVFDPEDDPLRYAWEVTDGVLAGEAGPQVEWTAPELPPDGIVPPKVVTVYLYVRDDGEEDVHKMATITVFSKPYKIAQFFSGTYTLISKQVNGDPIAETSILRLTPTTFTREIQSNLEAEVQEPTQFITGSHRFVEPFDESSGTIHWYPTGSTSPDISTYTWDGRLFVIFYPETATSYIYEK
ncbi:hypothetical protein F4054_23125 [Candidatus Poribacteria bacterium]|nr:hypothetical protein [Candidatus Poribacteria bacterium]MYG09124.1 hypothetical protein [Candidatus Poribacteria bacterium]MYK25144.1 hypothetical protein [Candidatus Poribacteria bacterium]